ncbi:MAG: DUF502 domain-containing protein [Candidatus Omnitrophota bacterium]|jgi:uncharacterized membrane protein
MTTHFRRYIITGLLVILPFFLTGYILYVLFRFADGILGKIINKYLSEYVGFYIPGLGLILSVLIILSVGYGAVRFTGRGYHIFLEKWFTRFPLTRYIYPSVKQIVEFFFSDKNLNFKKVVLIEYPRKGIWSMGFMTNEGFAEASSKVGVELLSIFIPTTPTPLSGFFMLVPCADVIFMDINIEDAIKVIVSGGLVNPPVRKKSA